MIALGPGGLRRPSAWALCGLVVLMAEYEVGKPVYVIAARLSGLALIALGLAAGW